MQARISHGRHRRLTHGIIGIQPDEHRVIRPLQRGEQPLQHGTDNGGFIPCRDQDGKAGRQCSGRELVHLGLAPGAGHGQPQDVDNQIIEAIDGHQHRHQQQRFGQRHVPKGQQIDRIHGKRIMKF